jgi:Cache domain
MSQRRLWWKAFISGISSAVDAQFRHLVTFEPPVRPFSSRKQMPVGRRVFLAVVLSQLFSIAVIVGWYFYAARSELGNITQQRVQEAVLRSIAATEDYFKPAETALEAGQLLLSDHILGPDKPDLLERYLFGQLRLRPLLAGLYVGNPAGEFFYVMRSSEKAEGGTRTKVIRNGPLGREVELTWRGPDYAIIKSERDPADTYDPRARGWYRSAVERRGRAWTEPYIFFTARKPGITLASAIMGKDGAVEAVLGVDVEMSEISRFLARTSLLREKSVYISTQEGKVIAHSNASVVLPDSAAGDGALRFRVVSELPGIEGALGEGVRKRLSEPAGTRSANVWEAETDGQHYFVAVGQMSNIDWPWQVVVTVPRTRQLEPGSESTILLIGAVGLATLFACAVGYAMSRAIGAPMSQLLTNARLARNGNVELMADVNTGIKEINETDEILKEFAAQRRRGRTL